MNEEFEGLGLVDLIDLLEEVPEPPPIYMAPQTVGWLLLGVACIGAVLYAIARIQRHRRANDYRHAALQVLTDAGDELQALAAILKRTALAVFPRQDVAALVGPDRLTFLDRTFPGSGFVDGRGRALISGPCRREDKAAGLPPPMRDWVQKHTRAEHG